MAKEVVKVNKLVRNKTIDKLIKDNANPKYIEVQGHKKSVALNELLKQYAEQYVNLSVGTMTVKDENFELSKCKEQIKCLVEIEELVKSIGLNIGVEWRTIWSGAKLAIPEKSLEQYIEVYLADFEQYGKDKNAKDLFGKELKYIEASLFEELKKYSLDYGKFYVDFQTKRINKRKIQGDYSKGYMLKSYEKMLSPEAALGK